MPATDSYDALRRSIERSLATDLPQGPIADLAASIDHALLEEARAGELTLAYLRLVAVAAYVAVAGWGLVAADTGGRSGYGVAELALAAIWGGGAVALTVLLRRGWYRLWLRHVVPAADAAMIWSSFVLAWARGSDAWATRSAEALSHATALCAFLAVSGALRLSRSSANLSTLLALAIFVFAGVASRVDLAYGVAIVATLATAGVLSAVAPARIRKVVTHQIGRMALSRMYDDARRAIDAREEVLKIVSHDLRNPLNTISMSASLMLEVELPEEQRVKRLATIKRAGERMNRLIQDLLDVAKLEAGRLAIDPRPTDVAPLVAEAIDMLRPLASEKGITLDAAVADGLPTVTVDPGRVLQALSNLVGNAVKFTRAGGRVAIRAERVAGSVRFCVADTGAGIPPEQLSKIFGRFWQADRSDRRGIGLGLAITKGIVEAHGGRIWVESRVGEGTTFYFTLAADAVGIREPEERRSAADRRRAPVREDSAPAGLD